MLDAHLEIAASLLEEKFVSLKNQWWKSCRWLSVIDQIIRDPAYQAIIQIGQPAIPLILHDWQREPKHWHWALVEISGENPVPAEDLGDLPKMREHWLRWGGANGWRRFDLKADGGNE
jgi:hypothetical protein